MPRYAELWIKSSHIPLSLLVCFSQNVTSKIKKEIPKCHGAVLSCPVDGFVYVIAMTFGKFDVKYS